MFKTSDFDFNLPENLIAKSPCFPKDHAKMLIWKDTKLTENIVRNLGEYLKKGDVLVFNDAKVIKARLDGKRDEVKIQINLHQNIKNNIWKVFAKPSKRLKIGDKLIIAEDFFALVLGKDTQGLVDLEFNSTDEEFFQKLDKYGKMPLPPYIKRDQEKIDEINYQTIYAKNSGAVAAPTAGLHFTDELFADLEKRNIQKVFVTLNVGAGTFLPVKSELIQDHQMHSEFYSIDQKSCDIINEAKKSGKRIIAVGTTSLRVLESSADENGLLKPAHKNTEIFIYPPYKFKIADILLTNFHLPKSTLFMLICAFIGKDSAFDLYDYAIKNNYRFYSYGDCCLLFNEK